MGQVQAGHGSLQAGPGRVSWFWPALPGPREVVFSELFTPILSSADCSPVTVTIEPGVLGSSL